MHDFVSCMCFYTETSNERKTLQFPDSRIRTCKKWCNIPEDLNLQVKDVFCICRWFILCSLQLLMQNVDFGLIVIVSQHPCLKIVIAISIGIILCYQTKTLAMCVVCSDGCPCPSGVVLQNHFDPLYYCTCHFFKDCHFCLLVHLFSNTLLEHCFLILSKMAEI